MDVHREAADPRRRRNPALFVLCLGVFMVLLDTNAVTAALPAIRTELGFTDTSLAWVVNAHALLFAGTLLVAGRLVDIFGGRRLFLIGLSLFTASALCGGLASARWILISSRAMQGIGAAIIMAVPLSLIVALYEEGAERDKAMSMYGFVCGGAGSVGLLLGGALTGALGWHWIYLIHVPLGVGAGILALRFIPTLSPQVLMKRIDVWGVVTVTASMMMVLHAVGNANEEGWASLLTLGQIGAGAALFVAFLAIEVRSPTAVVPPRILRLRQLMVACAIVILWTASGRAWLFLSSIYLQSALGYRAEEVGLTFLPANLVMAALTLGFSASLVRRFGVRNLVAAGLFFVAIGLALFARVSPMHDRFAWDVLPPTLLVGIGSGILFNPLLLAATSGGHTRDSGIISGVFNTAMMLGGTLGVAGFSSLASARSFQLSFLLAACCTLLAAVMGFVFLSTRSHATTSSANRPAAERMQLDGSA